MKIITRWSNTHYFHISYLTGGGSSTDPADELTNENFGKDPRFISDKTYEQWFESVKKEHERTTIYEPYGCMGMEDPESDKRDWKVIKTVEIIR